MSGSTDDVVVAAVGDVLVERANPTTAFAAVKSELEAADIRFANCEGPYTSSEERNTSSWGWVLSDPANFPGVVAGGFDVLSLANNHIMDAGYSGLHDTLSLLREAGIKPVGAGADLAQARSPAIEERHGVRVGFLAYTCCYAPGFQAWSSRPGCATIAIETIYEQELGQPGTRPRVLTYVNPAEKAAVSADVERVRSEVDFLVVSTHWGIHNLPAVLSDYERELGHALVDAGADAVLGHHQHIIKGVEMYREKPIFYGIGNFLFDTSTDRVLARSAVAKEAFAEFAPFYGEYVSHHPESKNTMLVRLRVNRNGLADVAFVPCLRRDSDGEPEPLDPSDKAFAESLDYVRDITARAGLNGQFNARGREIAVST